jgi:hypothetical protein
VRRWLLCRLGRGRDPDTRGTVRQRHQLLLINDLLDLLQPVS